MKIVISLLFTGLLVSGCSVNPKPLSLEELVEKRDARLEQLTAEQEELSGPVSLYEAMARAIKYNLDHKVEVYEEALRTSENGLATLDMLPKLVVSAGLTDRNNYSGSRSRDLVEGEPVGNLTAVPTTSSEKSVVTSDLKLSWDVLDFGLSYVRAKQKANAVLVANEVSAERLIEKLSNLESDLENALTAAEQSFRKKKTPPLAALTYQRELLSIQNEIQTMQNEMVVAKRQLAALMNVNPGTRFTLMMPSEGDEKSLENLDPEDMVKLALLYRPELRELSYEQRINEGEATAALMELLPNLNFFGGFNYNSNEYLYHNEWAGWGAAASWNIFKLFRYPGQKRANKLGTTLLEQRALALTMAVITQVHVSASKYEISKRRLETMTKYQQVTNDILDQIAAGYKTRKVSYQNFVREKMNSIVAQSRYDMARAEMQNSYANIYASLGIDTYGEIDAEESTVSKLAQHLQEQWLSISDVIGTVQGVE